MTNYAQLREIGGGSPVDLGDRVGVAPQRGCTGPAVAETRGGVAQVQAARKELAGGEVPAALDVELHPGRIGRFGHPVRGPVRVPRLGVGGVVGEQVRVSWQMDTEGGELGPDSLQVIRDEGTGSRVDGEPAVLVSLSVLADTLATADDVIEGDRHGATVEVDVTDLQTAQLAAAHAGDHDQPQVQPEGGAVITHCGDYPRHIFWRGGGDGLPDRGGRLGRRGGVPVGPLPPLSGGERAGQDAVVATDRAGLHRMTDVRAASDPGTVVVLTGAPADRTRTIAGFAGDDRGAAVLDDDQVVRGELLEGVPDDAAADALEGAYLGDRRQLVARGQAGRGENLRDLQLGRAAISWVDHQGRDVAVLGEGPPGTGQVATALQPRVQLIQDRAANLPHLQVPEGGLDSAADESLVGLPGGHVPRRDGRVLVQEPGHRRVGLRRPAFGCFLEQPAQLDVGLPLGLGGGLEADPPLGDRIDPGIHPGTPRPARQLLYAAFGNSGHAGTMPRMTDIRSTTRSTQSGPKRALPPLTWEPVSGFEPLTCRLQEVRFIPICALTALISRGIALVAPTELGLSDGSSHDSSHDAEQPLTRKRLRCVDLTLSSFTDGILSQDELACAIRQAGDRVGEPNGCTKRIVQRWQAGLVRTPRGPYARALEYVTGQTIQEHDGVVVHVDDPQPRRDALGDLVVLSATARPVPMSRDWRTPCSPRAAAPPRPGTAARPGRSAAWSA